MIEIREAIKHFSDFSVSINFTIAPSEVFGIIGESGSGKTTILKLIQEIIALDAGTILTHGSFATVFQEANLLNNLSVFDNVALPLRIQKQRSQDRVLEALRFVGLESLSHLYPSALSGGQKQRVSIARAIVTRPDILLCDEPTSSLDKNTSKDTVDLLSRINSEYGTTMVLVTHELDVAKALCDRVAVMERGRVIDIIDNDKRAMPENIPYYDYIKEVFP